ncbi:histidine phosphatase superfamily [Rhexocercosporidium sp. MPI-PUGE-AT-0058]|nr:histidine phosphatase superfamily [Rhexocercosporidium sp. MPI-PUGE-AT-0058]
MTNNIDSLNEGLFGEYCSLTLQQSITSSATVDPSLFPSEPVVGFPGPTPTGLEPAAIQTAPTYPYNNGPANQFPLIAPQPHADYGLPDASPLIPEGCNIIQMHLLYRHGARCPTSGAAPSTFAQKLYNATRDGGFRTYKLGAELLSPFCRSQNFNLEIAYRQLYGELLNNFTEAGTLLVFRTESQDRMVKTAENFAAGFFGVPDPGANNSGAPYEVCTNSNVESRGSIGSTVATTYASSAFNSKIARLQSQLQLCSYETHALGYSKFCTLFSEEDFLTYDNGPSSPVSAAQEKGYLQEWVARLTHSFPSATSALNKTFDKSTTFFPLHNSIYADATHEVVILDTLTAFNLSALFKGPPLDPKGNEHNNAFVASMQVPFVMHFTTQVLVCPAYTPTRQIHSYSGCSENSSGLCSLDTVISALQKMIAEIVYDYDCFSNYTANAGIDYNGRAPRS